MSKLHKSLIALVVLPLIVLITGCNSEGAFSDTTVKLKQIEITASPITTQGVSQLTLAAGNEQIFEATGYYSDGSSQVLTDLSTSNWHTSDQYIGYFNASGVLVGDDSPGIVTVYAIKDGITSNTIEINVTAAVITEIQVTPSPVNMAKLQQRPLTAMATYSDNTSADVASSATWTSGDVTTATVGLTGYLTGKGVGTTTVTATKDGITSNEVNVSVCDLRDDCIDIFDTGSGKLFTSSPSVTYSNENGVIYSGTEIYFGVYSTFTHADAVVLCDTTYRDAKLEGRTNWRLPEIGELRSDLFDHGEEFSWRKWWDGATPPTPYWSATRTDTDKYYATYIESDPFVFDPSSKGYTSCVSDP